MGQVALGIRSLAFKVAVSFVLAAIWVWLLGGTLWPRPVTVDLPSMTLGAATVNLQVTVQESDQPLVWVLMKTEGKDRIQIGGPWRSATDLMLTDNGACFGARNEPSGPWIVYSIDQRGTLSIVATLDSRLHVEQQLEALATDAPAAPHAER